MKPRTAATLTYTKVQRLFSVQKSPTDPKKSLFYIEKYDYPTLKAKAWEAFEFGLDIAKKTLADTQKLRYYHKEKGTDLTKYTLNEIKEKSQLTTDVIVKVIPYVIIIALPFSPFLMAIYVVLAPNSTPRYFLPDSYLVDKYDNWRSEQLAAREQFIQQVDKRYSNYHGIKMTDIQRTSWTNMTKEAHIFNKQVETHFSLPFTNSTVNRFSLENLTAFELELLARIFVLDYVPGYRLVNLFAGLFLRFPFWLTSKIAKRAGVSDFERFKDNSLYRIRFSLDHGPLASLKKYALIYQIHKHFTKVRQQDIVLAQNLDQIDTLSDVNLLHFAQDRGIMIQDPDNIKKFVREHWLPLSLRQDIPISLLMMSVVFRTHSIPASVKEL